MIVEPDTIKLIQLALISPKKVAAKLIVNLSIVARKLGI